MALAIPKRVLVFVGGFHQCYLPLFWVVLFADKAGRQWRRTLGLVGMGLPGPIVRLAGKRGRVVVSKQGGNEIMQFPSSKEKPIPLVYPQGGQCTMGRKKMAYIHAKAGT